MGHHTWAIVLSDNFRSEEAMQHYLCQLQISPEHPHSYNGIGTTLHDMRRYEDAIFYYKMQLLFNPMNKYSHLNMSLAYARLKQYDKAEREHRIQLLLHPTDRNTCDYFLELLAEMRKPEMGVEFFKGLVAKQPWRVDWRVNLARAYTIVKDFGNAAAELQQVLRVNRCDSRALIGLAELFERNGYYLRASKLLRRLVEIFPRHGRVRSFLGDCEIKLGNYDAANTVLQEQVRMFPNDPEAYCRMAELVAQKGETEDAIALYKKARSVDPTDSSSLFNIGLCYLDLQNFPEARAYFQQHLAENPGDPMSLLEIANTYYASGELELSIRHYRAVLDVKPDHHDCRAWLASTLSDCGRRLEAIAEFERLIADTGKLAFHYNIGMLYIALANITEDHDQAWQYRRLADIHAQLEVGVGRKFVEAFNPEAERARREDDPLNIIDGGRLTPQTAWILREDSLPTGTPEWSPAVHRYCSRLARKQVMTLLLLMRRVEVAAGYPFPPDIKFAIIREMLAAPSEGFVRSVVGPVKSAQLFDNRSTACFRPVPPNETLATLVQKCTEAGFKVRHSFALYWPIEQEGGLPLAEMPKGADPSKYTVTVYLTCDSIEELAAIKMLPVFQGCHALKLSPAEMVYVPYESASLDAAQLEPYTQAVGLFCQCLRNRQMCEAAYSLASEADNMPSLLVAVSYGLGNEQAVKSAINVLLQRAKKGDVLACYNAVVVICLLLVKLGTDDWSKHFEQQTE